MSLLVENNQMSAPPPQGEASTGAPHTSAYLALVMAFVAAADAEEATQKAAGNSLLVQEQRINEVEADQNAMQQMVPQENQLAEAGYMQEMVDQSQSIDAKETLINMNIQSTVQLGVTDSSQREQSYLQQGSEIVQVLQGLTRGM